MSYLFKFLGSFLFSLLWCKRRTHGISFYNYELPIDLDINKFSKFLPYRLSRNGVEKENQENSHSILISFFKTFSFALEISRTLGLKCSEYMYLYILIITFLPLTFIFKWIYLLDFIGTVAN